VKPEITYCPAALLISAVVLSDALPLTTDAVSPFTNPEMEAVNTGLVSPKGRETSSAFTVRLALAIVKD
jgi:hypothetical protein